MKMLLFHAVKPAPHEPRELDWDGFTREARIWTLPEGAERLAPNVWVLPDDGKAEMDLANIAQRYDIATRSRPFARESSWHQLSRLP